MLWTLVAVLVDARPPTMLRMPLRRAPEPGITRDRVWHRDQRVASDGGSHFGHRRTIAGKGCGLYAVRRLAVGLLVSGFVCAEHLLVQAPPDNWTMGTCLQFRQNGGLGEHAGLGNRTMSDRAMAHHSSCAAIQACQQECRQNTNASDRRHTEIHGYGTVSHGCYGIRKIDREGSINRKETLKGG
jgi:hypothetical protein